jgi:hypothetical protein
MRKIAKVDALFVEGPDDGALVNAFVNRLTGIDLAREPYRLVKAQPAGGDKWAVRQFKQRIDEGRPGARIGLIVDRDQEANDKWPTISAILQDLGVEPGAGPDSAGAIYASNRVRPARPTGFREQGRSFARSRSAFGRRHKITRRQRGLPWATASRWARAPRP